MPRPSAHLSWYTMKLPLLLNAPRPRGNDNGNALGKLTCEKDREQPQDHLVHLQPEGRAPASLPSRGAALFPGRPGERSTRIEPLMSKTAKTSDNAELMEDSFVIPNERVREQS